jgi:uncharacterized protein
MNVSRTLLTIIALLFAFSAWSSDSQKGLDAYNSMDYETALAIWQPLAEAGDADSQFGLGMMYANGFGVELNDALAFKWYGLAAEQGHARAHCNLAIMYQNGWGVAPDEEKAISYYKLAAEGGDVPSMTALGRYYAMDFSAEYDPVQAYKWFSLADLLEDRDAALKREVIAAKMTAAQIAEGEELVATWSSKHAELMARQ